MDLAAVKNPLSKAEIVRSILINRRALMVLDNAEDASDLELLLPTGGPTIALVTTRDIDIPSLQNAMDIHLYVFREREALEHLAGVIGLSVLEHDSEHAHRLVTMCGHLPLALDIAARAVRRAGLRLSSFVDVMAKEQQGLDVLHDRGRSVLTCFNLTWESLDQRQRDIFAALSVFAGSTFDVNAVAHVCDAEPMAMRIAIGELIALSLVRVTQSGRYYLHPLLREYSVGKMKAQGESLWRTRNEHAVNHYLALATRSHQEYESGQGRHESSRLELENMLGAWAWARAVTHDSPLVGFAQNLAPFLFSQGYWDHCRDVLESGIEATGRIGDLDAHFSLRLRQAELARERADYDSASDELRRSMDYFSSQGDERHLATVTRELGELRRVQRHYLEARQLHRRALELRVHQKDVRGQAQSLHDLGLVEHILGRYAEARSSFETSLRMSREIADDSLVSYNILELGIVALRSGLDVRAKPLLEQCLEMFIAQRDKRGEAYACRELGTLALRQGRFETAKQWYVRSLELRTELGDLRGQAISYHRLGYVEQSLGNYQSATRLYEQSMEIASALGDRFHLALNYVRVGEIAAHSGELSKARGHWRVGLDLLHDLGVAAEEADVARRHLEATAGAQPDDSAPDSDR
jgi:tetratricopeptide (TPR) repeat protein